MRACVCVWYARVRVFRGMHRSVLPQLLIIRHKSHRYTYTRVRAHACAHARTCATEPAASTSQDQWPRARKKRAPPTVQKALYSLPCMAKKASPSKNYNQLLSVTYHITGCDPFVLVMKPLHGLLHRAIGPQQSQPWCHYKARRHIELA